MSPASAPNRFAHFSTIKIPSTTNSIPALQPGQTQAPPVAATAGFPTSALLGNVFPITLPGGGELTAAGAQALGLGLKFKWPGSPIIGYQIGRNASPKASTACYVSPQLAAQRSSNPRLVEGVQDFTSLIAGTCGAGVKLLNDSVWLGHDFIVFYRDLKDPEVSPGARLVSVGQLGSSALGVLAGVLHASWLDQASTSLHFAASVGEHLHTGKMNFSQSELLQLSSAPGAEEYSNIVALTELVLPST
jgi:hypothetical protein